MELCADVRLQIANVPRRQIDKEDNLNGLGTGDAPVDLLASISRRKSLQDHHGKPSG